MKKRKRNDNIKCDICGYCNHKEYVSYCGICHGCGKILDDRVHFRYKMNRKLRIWRDDRPDVWEKGNNRLYNNKASRIKNKNGISR